ncbi:helix-turn-helix domain-containing protein [Inquilinus sp. Marseille-Q2685]|uniref:winged helix-turn-helix transcriptional regulator n=1 Tax=Inquilinus sp. Marseille-Q2685 TaxID=2866581 RepID=UPI001CE4536C|nr:helix-turn-helix domain-containing protein [Inquilinus sp. Marseille-Q2685]
MQRTSFAGMDCPIARALDALGEWWSLLILRDAFLGLTRFDDFQHSLGIAPNMLARRLKSLAEAGLLERHAYSHRPLRHEYRLTPAGRDVFPVLAALGAWGSRHATGGKVLVQLAGRADGAPIDPVLVDRRSGLPVTPETAEFRLGPDAGPAGGARAARIRLAERRNGDGVDAVPT